MSQRPEMPGNLNARPHDEPDEVWSLISDLRSWLEWQAECGAKDWAVDDWGAWVRPVARTSNRTQERSDKMEIRPPENVKKLRAEDSQEPVVGKPVENIPKAWQNVVNNSGPKLNVQNLPIGEEGFSKVRQFQQENGIESGPYQFGVGNISAPVLIVAGDRMSMVSAGFKMLSNMREHVLKLDKSQLYFIEFPFSGQGSVHEQIFHGVLRAKAPKFILIMGEACASNLFTESKKPLMGEQGELKCLGTVGASIPAMWTHHPHHLIEKGHEKRTVMRHLQNMRRWITKLGIQ